MTAVWIFLAVSAEVVLLLLPIACAFSGKGYFSIWSAIFEEELLYHRIILNFVLPPIFFGLISGLGAGLLLGLSAGLVFGLAVGFVNALIWFPDWTWDSIQGGTIGETIRLGFFFGNTFGLFFALSVNSAPYPEDISYGEGLRMGLLFGLGYGLFAALSGLIEYVNYGLAYGVVNGLCGLISSLLSVLLMFGLRHLSEGFTFAIKSFFKPWEVKTYSFWKAVASFIVTYIMVVLIFYLWFYACYLEGKEKEHPYFRIDNKVQDVNWWHFVYFSFVTITTLGYGDISPLHPFPQVLVFFETMIGLGLVTGYLGIIIAGQINLLEPLKAKEVSEPPNLPTRIIKETASTKQERKYVPVSTSGKFCPKCHSDPPLPMTVVEKKRWQAGLCPQCEGKLIDK